MSDWLAKFSEAARDYAGAVERLLSEAMEEGSDSTAVALHTFEAVRTGMGYTQSLMERIQDTRAVTGLEVVPSEEFPSKHALVE